MYEDKVKASKSKRFAYQSPFEFLKSISIYFKRVEKSAVMNTHTEEFVSDVMGKIISDVELIYGIKNVDIGVMVFDFFTTDKGYKWMRIVDNTKRYFGV
jgi:hypothetical protein